MKDILENGCIEKNKGPKLVIRSPRVRALDDELEYVLNSQPTLSQKVSKMQTNIDQPIQAELGNDTDTPTNSEEIQGKLEG
ncbi:hypothetical protein KC669_04255 [Candidatus Dojkabacteria bacterium]|uniref:Uncharacterized protein n=1 Tax=Candidatus Dojkabacteria bacterium TaxID=2099670 RepID=A0A955LAY4_9BACT|nr:hypothetical protein [Candidatus Dojkabacteria bacterium]